MAKESVYLEIIGAREHNLRNINLRIPRNELVVITGLSGSGKSSLAFDTIFAEGQRRYLDTFAAYARQFMGGLKRPDVDKISGLSPVIAIEQKSGSKNPRSTVGTITEVYDYLRLLFARVSTAYSSETGKEMVQYSDKEIRDLISLRYDSELIYILAPLVKARKGHYRELFEQYRKMGFMQMYIDGELVELKPKMQIDRYKIHDIDVLIDRIEVKDASAKRLKDALDLALRYGKGNVSIIKHESSEKKFFSRNLMCEESGISYEMPEPNTFSFNSAYGACQNCKGIGKVSEIDMKKVIPEPRVTIRNGGIAPLGPYKNNWIYKQVELICRKYGQSLDEEVADLNEDALHAILYGSNEMLTLKNDYVGVTSSYNLSFDGIINILKQQNEEELTPSVKRWADSFMNMTECPACNGSRLKSEAQNFRIDGKTIHDISSLDIQDLKDWIEQLPSHFDERKNLIATDVLKELSSRVSFLLDVGLEYLSLDRPAYSLSGGEMQRIRLATQIGSRLRGVLYILDEPSIGLHQDDNRKLIASVRKLRDMGNSVIVVEHDEEMIRSADYILDMGPGAGREGGLISAEGKLSEMMKCSSLTCDYLSGRKQMPLPEIRRPAGADRLVLKGASGHNLQKIDVEFPLGLFICVTGVSGSGKSTLVNETLYPSISREFYRSLKEPLSYQKLEGLELIDKVVEIDQSPIGRTPRSNPATYTGVFDEIRKLYASLPESKARGYKPGRFSFNVSGGRCETCKGAGLKTIEMNFLPDVYVTCDDCYGKRYNKETLEVRFKGKSISDVLDMTINQSVEFFDNHPRIRRILKTLQKVGLGYISLGQQSTTVSGGEAQRVKLSSELSRKASGKTLYILDEPTTGLHFDDIRVLLEMMNELVAKGNTAIVIEHNLDVIAFADYIVDLGPGGGKNGGKIVGVGTPEQLAAKKNSLTGKHLKAYFLKRKNNSHGN
ncbi:MAG: excinuclease ABC subunit UvrA [Bacteroidales bacterium]|nr:excinuclease ABC subunit UvrA [Bacteroidales bacterium]